MSRPPGWDRPFRRPLYGLAIVTVLVAIIVLPGEPRSGELLGAVAFVVIAGVIAIAASAVLHEREEREYAWVWVKDSPGPDHLPYLDWVAIPPGPLPGMGGHSVPVGLCRVCPWQHQLGDQREVERAMRDHGHVGYRYVRLPRQPSPGA